MEANSLSVQVAAASVLDALPRALDSFQLLNSDKALAPETFKDGMRGLSLFSTTEGRLAKLGAETVTNHLERYDLSVWDAFRESPEEEYRIDRERERAIKEASQYKAWEKPDWELDRIDRERERNIRDIERGKRES